MKRKKLSNFYLSSKFNFYIYYVLKSIYRFLFFNIVPDKVFLKRKFKKRMGYKLDLNNPIDFNEKLQWLKLYDREKEYTDCADKYKSREYIKKILGADADKYLIPLLFETKNVNDLNLENLPDYPFIIKTNHDQGGFKIIWDKNDVNLKEIQMFFFNRLKWNHFWNNREWPYRNIEKRIIVEKLLHNSTKLPKEIKLHCFHGHVKIIEYQERNDKGVKRFAFYDKSFARIKKGVIDTKEVPQLEEHKLDISNLKLMIDISEKISEQMKYVRVDLYDINNAIYVGEITFFDSAGYIQHFTKDFLKEIGTWIAVNDI